MLQFHLTSKETHTEERKDQRVRIYTNIKNQTFNPYNNHARLLHIRNLDV